MGRTNRKRNGNSRNGRKKSGDDCENSSSCSESDYEMDKISVVTLEERKDLMDECVDLLNSQWPRSKTARLRNLEQTLGHSKFPVSLLLIGLIKKKETLIGYSKIAPVPYDDEKCFVESVVVAEKFRGKNYGRTLMEKTEDYAKKQGVKVMHLTTHDKQGFYWKLGYEFCEPIVVFGGCSPNIQKLLQSVHSEDRSTLVGTGMDLKQFKQDLNDWIDSHQAEESNDNNQSEPAAVITTSFKEIGFTDKSSQPVAAALPPRPPPPPLPPPLFQQKPSTSPTEKVQIVQRLDGTSSGNTQLKMHMKKIL